MCVCVCVCLCASLVQYASLQDYSEKGMNINLIHWHRELEWHKISGNKWTV